MIISIGWGEEVYDEVASSTMYNNKLMTQHCWLWKSEIIINTFITLCFIQHLPEDKQCLQKRIVYLIKTEIRKSAQTFSCRLQLVLFSLRNSKEFIITAWSFTVFWMNGLKVKHAADGKSSPIWSCFVCLKQAKRSGCWKTWRLESQTCRMSFSRSPRPRRTSSVSSSLQCGVDGEPLSSAAVVFLLVKVNEHTR